MSFVVFTVLLTGAGCEREIPLLVERDDPDEIEGYQISGKLSDRIGNPLQGVAVSLSYDYVFVNDDPPPTRTYQVPQGSDTVVVQVVDRKGFPLRTLFRDRISPGPLTVDWDTRDGAGTLVPSSVYHVQYLVGNDVKHSYPVTISGRGVATSDSLGRFNIPDEYLPVDFYPVPLQSADGSRYLGNHRIIPYVTLRFTAEGINRGIYLSLIKNEVKRLELKF